MVVLVNKELFYKSSIFEILEKTKLAFPLQQLMIESMKLNIDITLLLGSMYIWTLLAPSGALVVIMV